MTLKKYTNSLINETSPYLLQHAHNPVNWYAWNEETLEKAKRENKIILISVGYSACHWCHVMEHESFEDEQVAQLMNDHFICIKVDREERPDIDQVYMLAVQLMTGRGGWPLNCFALPDGRPVYGGTYFPKQQWMNLLLNLADLHRNEPEKMIDYATQLTEGVKLAEVVKVKEEKKEFSIETLEQCYKNWQPRFDTEEGGPDKAPKFPLPNNYQFLLRLAFASPTSGKNKAELLQHIELTLQKMAYGGIYDQIGGGFSRYSVDHYWKVPHFEKMLYDNAQLVTLYSEAYQATKNSVYKQVVYETLGFIEREMTSAEGAFYSALDADSEGEEGKYYVWEKDELQTVLKENFNLFADYFNINDRGLWEYNNYILLRHDMDETIAAKYNMSVESLQDLINKMKERLLTVREKRIHPGLDDKTLTSWNALMLKGYVDAYNVFDEQHFLDVAVKNCEFLFKNVLKNDGGLNHIASKTPSPLERVGVRSINGFLEDYCFTIEALIALYEATFTESYLLKANALMNYCITHFYDQSSGMFYFTSDEDKALITRKMELSDNVIPASNSSIAKSLFILGHHFENEKYITMSKIMLNNVLAEIVNYGAGYSNWAMLLLNFTLPFYELAIVGKAVDEKRKAFNKHYVPSKIFAGSAVESTFPLLKNRIIDGQTMIYVCSNKTCNKPVIEVSEALKQIAI
ncbi:MAG: thioredoxin domain-containing protein [Bacteroidetes bacterium]|nr:thioredoxin domain-containing protein [Bacteroidota bacterium]